MTLSPTLDWNDATNREGHAAKVYFNALFGLNFTRTSDNFVNAALNYGYSIILLTFTREIVANGYITQLGLYHQNHSTLSHRYHHIAALGIPAECLLPLSNNLCEANIKPYATARRAWLFADTPKGAIFTVI